MARHKGTQIIKEDNDGYFVFQTPNVMFHFQTLKDLITVDGECDINSRIYAHCDSRNTLSYVERHWICCPLINIQREPVQYQSLRYSNAGDNTTESAIFYSSKRRLRRSQKKLCPDHRDSPLSLSIVEFIRSVAPFSLCDFVSSHKIQKWLLKNPL